MITANLLVEASRVTWSCSGVSFESSGQAYGYGGSGVEEVICETMPAQLIVAAALFWGIALLGLALWIATPVRRGRAV